MTLDTVNFETCAKLDTEANCVKGCQWYRGTGVKPVDPTKPVTQEGRCQLVSGSSTAIGTAPIAGSTPAVGTADVCTPVKDKSACYQMNGQCEWTYAPIVAPQYDCVSIDSTIPVAADNCMNIKVEADCSNLKDTCKW
jgi:hypothetical protein